MFNGKSHQKGKYIPINKHKYIGDIDNIRYLSSWEKLTNRWADLNPDIISWGSELIKIPYVCPTDNQVHTYIIDFIFKFKDGRVLLVEVKPENQTKLPKASKGKKKSTTLTEQLVFVKNVAKWKKANEYAIANNCKFVIWTETHLKKIGLPIL